MATINLCHWTYQDGNADGHPIYLVLYIRPNKYTKTSGYYVRPDQWDDDKRIVINHPNAKYINADLQRQKLLLERKIIEYALQGMQVTKDVLREGGKGTKFNDYARSVRGDNKLTATELSRLKEYLGRDPLITEINTEFLRKFTKWLYEERNLHNNTIRGTEKFFSRVMRQAKRDRLITFCPFENGGYKPRKELATEKVFLNEKEVGRFYRLLLSGKIKDDTEYKVLAYFLFECMAGFRHSDWGKFDPKKNYYSSVNPETKKKEWLIRLRATKNGEWITLPCNDMLNNIVAIITRIGKFTMDNGDCNEMLRDINEREQITNKHITTHVGRHSFGHKCASLGLGKEITAELMGVTVDVVEVYYHQTGDNIRKHAAALAK